MENDKTNIFLVAIVGIVAVAGLVFLFSGKGNTANENSLSGEAVFTASNDIKKNDVFLLPAGVIAPTTTYTVGELLQYKGADKITSANPKIKFKLLSLGESLEYAIPVSKQSEVNLKLGGKEFKVKLLKPTQLDSPIQVDFNGDGVVETSPNKINLFNSYSPGLKGLGYTCDQIITLQEGGEQVLGTSGKLKLIYLDSSYLKVQVETSTVDTTDTEVEPPLLTNGETWETEGYFIHPINILYQAYAGGVHQATFCINY